MMREPISSGCRLAITLRYLATGEDYNCHMFGFRVAANPICGIVPETCEAITRVLKEDYFKCPTTAAGWQPVIDGFWKRWNFPHCLGALDGKHCRIRKTRSSGSLYYNYKGYHSIVLIAVVDPEYRFMWVDVGAPGRNADGGVFDTSDFKEALVAGDLDLPPDCPLPHDDQDLPHCIVADEAFPLKTWLLKPYPYRNLSHDERIFNYRLSRARRIVENAFGILSNRWRVLCKEMLISPERAEKVIMAACSLHNLMRTRYPHLTNNLIDREDPVTKEIYPDGEWRQGEEMDALDQLKGNNATKEGKAFRNYLKGYFLSEAGSVPWQEKNAVLNH